MYSFPHLHRWMLTLFAVCSCFAVFLPPVVLASGGALDSIGLSVSSSDATSERRFVPHSYIVEFDSQQVTADSYKSHLSAFYQELSSQHPDWNIDHQFEYDEPDVFMGVSFFVRPSETLVKRGNGNSNQAFAHLTSMVMKKVRESPAVQNVWRDSLVYHHHESVRPRQRMSAISTGRSFVRRELQHYPNIKTEAQQLQSRSDTKTELNHYPPHVQQGIGIQHERGNKGRGIHICVLDTPIDAANPYLNGGKPSGTPCIGDGCPIVGGAYYHEKEYEDDDVHASPLPLISPTTDTECYHGSHVAGIIIADNATQFIGGSPEAVISSYGIFPCESGTTRDSIILDAYTQSAKHCDLVTGSFGTPGAWPTEPSAIAASRLGEKIPVVHTAGNNRDRGAFYTGAPAVGDSVVAVASTENLALYGIPLVLDSPVLAGSNTVVVQTAMSWTYNRTLADLDIVFTPEALEKGGDPGFDACMPFGDDMPDLSSSIVVAYRGDCSIAEKVDAVRAKNGNVLILVANQTIPRAYITPDSFDMYIGLIQRDTGDALLKAVKNSPVRATVSPDDPFKFISAPNPDAGTLSRFTSWGPDNLGNLKPHLAGVGGSILSTFPLPALNGVFDGTSMAAPLIASCIALYIAQHPDASPERVRRTMVHTGYPAFTSNSADSNFESLYLGAIIPNITRAIDTTTDVQPLNFDFNDATASRRVFHQELKVRNEGTEQRTYTIDHKAAQSYWALQEGAPEHKDPLFMALTVPEANQEFASVEIGPTTFILEPNATKTVRLKFQPPPQSARWNLYSGYIRVTSDTLDQHLVPYGGIAGVLSSLPPLQSGLSPFNTSMPALYGPNLTEQITNDTTVWTFNEDDAATFPVFCFVLQTPVEKFYIDLVDANLAYTPSVPIIDDVNATQSLLFEFPSPRQGGTKPSVLNTAVRRSYGIAADEDMTAKYIRVVDVPIVGRLTSDNDTIRNAVGRQLTEDGFYTAFPTLYPEKPGEPDVTFELQPGVYRVLLRAHRWRSGDVDLEANYESYLSRAFEYRPAANTTKVK